MTPYISRMASMEERIRKGLSRSSLLRRRMLRSIRLDALVPKVTKGLGGDFTSLDISLL